MVKTNKVNTAREILSSWKGLILVILFSVLFLPVQAQDVPPTIYSDRNNYYTFQPPAGWKKREVFAETVSRVIFHSPDGKASLGILAELNGANLNELFFEKKSFIKDYQRRYPKGRFALSLVVLGVRNVAKVNFEIPRVVKQEQYFFYERGIRFDLIYGVEDPADFEKYYQVALDAFSTIQSIEQIIWPRNK